ncbi:hypothetical protein ACFLU4_05805 [Chloroflexota bacterium]
MAEELGKIEKPAAAEFKQGRKLCFIPIIYCPGEPPGGYRERFDRYWEQVTAQVADLELKLGKVSRIYHELVIAGGEEGLKAIKELNDKSYQVVKERTDKGARLEATEGEDVLTEFLDWSRCLAIGLQNQRVFTTVYESYSEAGRKRSAHIIKQIDGTLMADEMGILLMREGHRLQFPPDIEVFYVTPPALDEIKRWLRDSEAKPREDTPKPKARKKKKKVSPEGG